LNGHVSDEAAAERIGDRVRSSERRLRVLKEAGLVLKRHQGRSVYCRLNSDAMKEAFGWLERCKTFWTTFQRAS
jgi:DNA-binding transcriptional ArsR family regulator